VPIQPIAVDVTPADLRKSNKKLSIMRYQFPLRLCAAQTVHKSQGDTYNEKVVIHMTGLKGRGACYTAATRTCQLDQVSIV
jgi:hypothetical protein